MPRKEIAISKQKHVQTYSPSVSMVESLKQGFGFGIGSSIARSLFSGATNTSHTLPLPPTTETKSCSVFVDQLTKCKEEGFCSEEFISSLKESLQKCNSH